MRLEVLPARKGDCLILHCGADDSPGMILVDGGPNGVWEGSLRPRLMGLRTERGLKDEEPLVINLLMVSHIDDDHINGIIKLLESMRERVQGGLPPLFRIDRLWHNSFDDILGNDETARMVKEPGQFGAASTEADRDAILAQASNEDQLDSLEVLASVRQGDDLRRLAEALDIPINPETDGALIQTPEEGATKFEVEGVSLTVLAPHRDQLLKLQADHDAWLRTRPPGHRDSTALLAALDDKSVPNLASLVFLARDGDQTILLTGDARSDMILAGLESSGLFDADGKIAVGILKMPHHGSIRNLDDKGDFLRRVTSRNYVFSGNGEHGNPDRETFDLLFRTRPGAEMNLYLTYRIEEIDAGRREVFERERDRKLGTGLAAPEWSDAGNGLAAILSPPPLGTSVIEGDGAGMHIPQG